MPNPPNWAEKTGLAVLAVYTVFAGLQWHALREGLVASQRPLIKIASLQLVEPPLKEGWAELQLVVSNSGYGPAVGLNLECHWHTTTKRENGRWAWPGDRGVRFNDCPVVASIVDKGQPETRTLRWQLVGSDIEAIRDQTRMGLCVEAVATYRDSLGNDYKDDFRLEYNGGGVLVERQPVP